MSIIRVPQVTRKRPKVYRRVQKDLLIRNCRKISNDMNNTGLSEMNLYVFFFSYLEHRQSKTGLALHSFSLLCSCFSLPISSSSPFPLYTEVFQCITGGHNLRHQGCVKVDCMQLTKSVGVVLQRLVQSLQVSSDFTLSGLGVRRTTWLCVSSCSLGTEVDVINNPFYRMEHHQNGK